MKRPERQLYIPPALRTNFNKAFEDTMEFAEDKYASEVNNRQAYFVERSGSSQRRSANIKLMDMQLDSSSSSSNPKNISDESCKDEDSSDLEDIEMENYRNNTKTPNSNLMKHEDFSDKESNENLFLKSEFSETKHAKGLFSNYGESSISDIETETDDHMEKGRVFTSTPNSDIVDENVLDAAKYTPEEESALESTLLGQSDIREITINTNSNKCDYNFDIYQDPSSIKNQQTDFSEIFGNSYIPPPVPPPPHAFQLPPIHRLLSHQISANHHVPPQIMQQLSIQLQHQRLLLSPSPQSFSLQPHSSLMPPVPRNVLSACAQPATPRASNPPRMPSFISPTLLHQVRFDWPSPHDTSPSLYLHQRNLNPRSLESYKQDEFFYIPPPVPPPQQMDLRQPIRNLNQRENVQSCLPRLNSVVKKPLFDEKIWPQDPETRR